MSMDSRSVNYKKAMLWNFLMCVIMFGSAVLVPYLSEGGQALHPVYLGLAAVLSIGAGIFSCVFEPKTSEGFLFWLFPLVYVISVAFLLLFDKPFTFPFWTFGGLLILCAFRLRYGMLMNLYLLFIIGSQQPELFSEMLVVQMLCLLLFGFVMPHVKVWKDAVNILIAIAAILVSVRIVCYITMNKESLTNDIFCVAIVYVIVVFAVLILSKVLKETVLLQEQNEHFEFLEELAVGAEEQDANVSAYIALTEGDKESDVAFDYVLNSTSENVSFQPEALFTYTEADEAMLSRLEELAEESAPLLVQLSQKFPNAFLHARRVAVFASEVAQRLEGVNVALVKCGSYYHEIGRLRGDRSVECTLLVAKEEDFPPALQTVLREHTVGGMKPTSKEAALVLLTDNICGMCEHLKKTQEGKILITKVIDRALNLRLAKGDLSQSGLTAMDLSIILNTMGEVIKEDMF